MANRLVDQNDSTIQGNPNATGAVMTPVQYQCADSFDGVAGNGLVDEISNEGDYKASPFKGCYGDGK